MSMMRRVKLVSEPVVLVVVEEVHGTTAAACKTTRATPRCFLVADDHARPVARSGRCPRSPTRGRAERARYLSGQAMVAKPHTRSALRGLSQTAHAVGSLCLEPNGESAVRVARRGADRAIASTASP
jgi:hypothetical protein